MRFTFLGVLVLLSLTKGFAQQTLSELQKTITECNKLLPDTIGLLIKVNLDEFENQLIDKGFLVDGSGQSYYNVYESIASENEFHLTRDTSFIVIDSIGLKPIIKCLYKLLTPFEIAEITPDHLEATYRINEPIEDPISLGIIATRVLKHLSVEDFQLQYFQYTSLLGFYFMADIKTDLFRREIVRDSVRIDSLIRVELGKMDQININGQNTTLDSIEKIMNQFLEDGTKHKAVKLKVSRESSYSAFVKLLDLLNSLFDQHREKFAVEVYGKQVKDLDPIQMENLSKEIPVNILIESE